MEDIIKILSIIIVLLIIGFFIAVCEAHKWYKKHSDLEKFHLSTLQETSQLLAICKEYMDKNNLSEKFDDYVATIVNNENKENSNEN